MEKILISVPEELAAKMRASIPSRQRSKVIVRLIENEIKRREKALHECAAAVEKDDVLRQEMQEWEETTLNDGLNDESW